MTTEKVRENRLRRMAARQSAALEKNRRRDPRAIGYGTYTIRTTDGTVGTGWTLDQVERYLATGERP